MSFNIWKLILLVLSGFITILVLMQGGRTDGLDIANLNKNKLSLFNTRKSVKTEMYFEVVTGVLIAALIAITRFAF